MQKGHQVIYITPWTLTLKQSQTCPTFYNFFTIFPNSSTGPTTETANSTAL